MANERLTLQIDAIATGQQQVEALGNALNRVSTIAEQAQTRLNTPPNVAGMEQAAKRVGDAFEHTVPQFAAASAAVRAFEGTLSVRAVERFLTSVLGLGDALQKIFPFIGGAATVAVFVELGEKAAEAAKKIDPIAQAQLRAVEATKALASGIQQLGKEINDLDMDRFEKVFGTATRNTYQANDIQQRSISSLDTQISVLKGLIAQRQGEISKFGTSHSPETFAARSIFSAITGIPIPGEGRVALAGADINTLNEALSKTIEERQKAQLQSDALVDSAAKERQDQIDQAAEDARQKAEARQNRVDQFGRRGTMASLSPIDRIYAEMRELFPGASESQRGKLLDSANLQASAELTRQEAAQRPLKPEISSEMSKDIADGLQRFDRDVLQYLTSLNSQTRTRTNNQISGIRGFAEHQARLSGIVNGNGPDEAQRELDIRTQALNMERRIVEAHSELFDMDTERFRLEKEAQDNQFAFEEKIAAYRKQQLEDAKQSESAFSNFAVSGFNALTTRGGTRGFVTGAARSLADTAVGNAAGALFKTHAFQSMLSSLHLPGFAGDLMKGTPFGPKGPTTELSNNTSATDDNTRATRDLTAVLSGGRRMSGGYGGGISIPGLSGSLGTDIFGNSIPDIGAGSDGGIMSTNAIPDSWTQLPGFSGGSGSGFGFNAKSIGTIAAAGAGAFLAYQGFKKGGASGALQGTGAALGTAALFDLEPISKVALAIGAAVTGVLSGFFNGPQQRANQINNELSQNQYLAPTPINMTAANGGYADFDSRGNLRTSGLSPYPTTAQPYITSRRLNWGDPRTYYNAPGYVQAPFSGGAPGSGQAPVGNTTIVINAMDAQSFADAAMRNRAGLGAAVVAHLHSNGGEALARTVAYHMGV